MWIVDWRFERLNKIKRTRFKLREMEPKSLEQVVESNGMGLYQFFKIDVAQSLARSLDVIMQCVAWI